jgi:putative endonuclease
MYTVYVLHSPKHEKIYIGFTGNVDARLLSHNELGTKGWTIKFRPWNLVHKEEYASKTEALKREKQLKTATGREWIWSSVVKM